MTRRRDDDDDYRPRRHEHGARGAFKSGFKLTLGVLFAIAFFFLALPMHVCAGCTMGLCGVAKVGEQAHVEVERAKADQAAKEQADAVLNDLAKRARPPKPAVRPVAVGDVVKLAGDDGEGFVAVSDSEKTHDLYAKAAAEKNAALMQDFLRSGIVTRTPTGTPAKVIELSGRLARVKLDGGPHREQEGWVSRDSLPKEVEKK